jgi:hypothetical protein
MSIREILKKRPLIGKILGEGEEKKEYKGTYFIIGYDTVEIYSHKEATAPVGTLTYIPDVGVRFTPRAIKELEHLDVRYGEVHVTSTIPLTARKTTEDGVEIALF